MGNVKGRVNGATPSAKVAAHEANEALATSENLLDATQLALDAAGAIPGLGIVPDLANAGISAARGDFIGAGLSLAAAIPFAGWGATAAKVARRGAGALAKQAEKKVAKEAVKEAEKKAAEKALKEKAEKEAAEKAAKEKAEKEGDSQVKKKKDPCAVLQNGVPGDGYRGGKHGSIKKGGSKYKPPRESHHMPADSSHAAAGTLRSDDCPAIQMDATDHHETASWGSSTKAKAYRARQTALLKRGKAGFLAAMGMDIQDIRSKFGDKYDGAIAQMIAWAKCKEYI